MRPVNCIHRQGLPLAHVSPARSYNFSLHINVPIFAAPQVSSAHQSKVLPAPNCTCINKPSAFELLLLRSDQSGPKSDSTSKRRSRPLSNQWPPFSSHSDGNCRDWVSHWKLCTSWQVANKKNCKKFSQRSLLRPDLSLCSELKKIGICVCHCVPKETGPCRFVSFVLPLPFWGSSQTCHISYYHIHCWLGMAERPAQLSIRPAPIASTPFMSMAPGRGVVCRSSSLRYRVHMGAPGTYNCIATICWSWPFKKDFKPPTRFLQNTSFSPATM